MVFDVRAAIKVQGTLAFRHTRKAQESCIREMAGQDMPMQLSSTLVVQ